MTSRGHGTLPVISPFPHFLNHAADSADLTRVHPSLSLDAGRFGNPRRSEKGFTLVELVIAVGLTAFVFAALAGLLGHSLRVLSVSKARTQGNEVATQGMEELQRLSYAALGVCVAATDPPAGFSDQAKPVNCPAALGAADYTYGEDPCNVTTSGAGTPKAFYRCTRAGITYDVSRYVAWGDVQRTAKRMAVLVSWSDAVGLHEVSQQSSVRAPGQGDIFGLDPPRITSTSVGPGTTTYVAVDSFLPSGTTITLQAGTANLASTDRVFAVFSTLDADGNVQTSSKGLTWTSSNLWNGTISPTDGFRFPIGTQFFSFGVVRSDDGKANSAFATPARNFCTLGGTCPSSSAPSFAAQNAMSSAGTDPFIKVDSSGSLVPDRIDLTAVTMNVVATDTVTVSFETSSGAVNVQLAPDPSSCDIQSCTWKGAVAKNSGYSFPIGPRKFYFAVAQAPGSPGVPAGSSPSTGAATTTDKTFTL